MVTESIFAPALGTLIVICLGVLIELLRQILTTLRKQGETVVVLHTILVGAEGSPGLVRRVDDLHEWRTKLQQDELDALRRRYVDTHADRRDK